MYFRRFGTLCQVHLQRPRRQIKFCRRFGTL
jgi:hypothetical protein